MAAGRGGAGGEGGVPRCGGSSRRATQIYTALLFQWSVKSKTPIQWAHTLSHTKLQRCLKSQSKLAPRGIATTLFTKGIVYVLWVLSICCRNLRSLPLSPSPCTHAVARSRSVFSLYAFPIRPLIKFKIVHIYLLKHVALTAHQTNLDRDTSAAEMTGAKGGHRLSLESKGREATLRSITGNKECHVCFWYEVLICNMMLYMLNLILFLLQMLELCQFVELGVRAVLFKTVFFFLDCS